MKRIYNQLRPPARPRLAIDYYYYRAARTAHSAIAQPRCLPFKINRERTAVAISESIKHAAYSTRRFIASRDKRAATWR